MAIQLAGVQLGILTGGPSSLTLEDLADVSVTSPQTGQYLRYNAGISEWQNEYINSDVYAFLTGTALGLSGTGLTSSNGITLTALSGPETIDIGLSLSVTGDATGTVTSGALVLTLATVNSDVGTYGSAFEVPIVTVDGKGLITSISTVAVSSSSANITGGAAGEIPWQSAPSTTLFTAAGTSNQLLQSNGTSSPTWTSAPTITGTNISGTASSLNIGGNAASVTTNANLTGDVTSVGNATTVVSVGGNDITLAGAFTTSGAYALTLTTSGTTNVTLPTSGTLATTTNINTALPSATTSQLYGGSGGAGIADIVTVGSGLTLSGGTLTSTGSGGTVTTVSVVSANGFAGTVATATTTPAITLSTSVTGILKGNGTAISAATAGTDYSVGTSALGTGILKSTTGTGALTIAVAADFPTLNQDTSGNAATATTSTNITGGAAGELPYQTGAGATGFTAAGTSNQVLQSNGTSAPTWTSTPTITGTNITGTASGLTVGDATNVYTTAQDNNQTYPLMLSNSTVTAFQSPTFDPDLQYNPFTDILTIPGGVTTPVFTSTVSTGTAPFSVVSTTQVNNLTAQYATDATNIAIASTSTNAPFYITLVDSASGYQPLDVDIGFSLNPSTGAMTVPGTITITSGTVTNLNSPVASSDAATKAYVDAATAGLNVHGAVQTTDTGTEITGAAGITYTAGVAGGSPDTGAGVGATLSGTGTIPVIGGYTLTAAGQRVLIKQFTGGLNVQNGIYVVTTLTGGWVLTRASDYNNSIYGEVTAGDFVFVAEGTDAGTSWVQTSVGSQSPGDVTKIGTDAIVFTQFSGAGTYIAGTGLSLTGNTFANTGVLSVTTNTGLSTNTSATGNVTITNTGVTSLVAGTNISVSSATGAVTVNVTGTVPTATTATNLSGTTQYSVPYQSGSATTSYVSPGTTGSVLITNSTGAAPSWSTTPTIVGTNFSAIPNGALTNSSITIGSTSVSLGATATTIAGLTLTAPALGTPTAIVLTNATGTAASLTAGTATNMAGGAAGEIPWQSAASTSGFTAAGTSNQLLQSNGTSVPTWTSAPTITGTNISGTATSLNIGGNAATVTTNANLTGDVTSVGNATTLATVNSNIGTFNNLTVNAKGLVTAATNVVYLAGTNPAVWDTWDPAFLNSSVTLSNGNLTATAVSQASTERSTTAISTGKYVFEVNLGTSAFIGIGDSTVVDTSFPGSTGNSIGWQNGLGTYNTHGTVSTSGPAPAHPIVMIAVNLDLGYAWLSANNVWVQGNPATNTSPSWTWTAGTPMYAMGGTTNGSTETLTGNFGQNTFTNTVPSGYNPGWGTPLTTVTLVNSFNGRTGAVTLSSSDVTTALGFTPGTVDSVSVVSANGFAGTVATSTTTPAITLSTSVTGILYGNGTSIAAATAGEFPTLNQSTTGNAATATTATTATNMAGGAAGEIPWQSAASTSGFTAAGTSNQLLQSNGTSVPTWTSAPTISGANITSATIPVASLASDTTTLGASVLTLGSTTNTLNYAATETIASAASVAIGAATSNAIIISGTTTITSFDTIAAGAIRNVTFSGVLTLTYNATSLILPSTANITTAANDCAVFESLGSGNWQCISYTKASGTALVTGSGSPYSTTQVFNGSSSVTAMKVTNVTELVDVVAAAPSSTQTFYVASGAVQLYTTNAANNWIINFGWSSGTSMNTEMSIGDSVTVCMLITQGATPYYCTAVKIDGSAQTVHWQGGSAPTAGYASGIDAYNFAIIKTASATYTVLGSLTQF